MKPYYIFKKQGKAIKFLVGNHFCDYCKKALFPDAALWINFGSNGVVREHLFCSYCADKKDVRSKFCLLPTQYGDQIHTLRVVEYLDGLPPGSHPMPVGYHGWSNPRGIPMSSFEAANKKEDPSVTVEDNTRLASRESFECCQIGNADMAFLEEKDSFCLDPDTLLSDLKAASDETKRLENSAKKELENKRGD